MSIISHRLIPIASDLPTDLPRPPLLANLPVTQSRRLAFSRAVPWNNRPLFLTPRMLFWFIIVCGGGSGRALFQSAVILQQESKCVFFDRSQAHSQWPRFTNSRKPRLPVVFCLCSDSLDPSLIYWFPLRATCLLIIAGTRYSLCLRVSVQVSFSLWYLFPRFPILTEVSCGRKCLDWLLKL